MDMLSLPTKYYAEEKNPLHLAGYTLALGMMVVGLLETIEGGYYYLKDGESNMLLGPLGVIAGGYMAYSYLGEAKIVGSY
tara:strand:- start:1199 stop:1438 length:240 start_codon:yes stop_codon:yes gene_type:complete